MILLKRYYQKHKKKFDFQITKEKLRDTISSEIKDKTQNSSVEVRGLWTSWSLWQKLIWLWKVKLKFGEKEWLRFLDSYDRELEEYELPKKFWMERLPKTVMIVDVQFIPVRPVEYINIKVILK